MAGAEAAGVPPDAMAVEVVVAAPAPQVHVRALTLPAGATVADALRAADVARWLPAEVLDSLSPSIWGRAAALGTPLRAHDRVVLTRALQVDPKEARRLRYRRDGLRQRVLPGQRPARSGPGA